MDIFESRNLHPFQCCKADDELLKKPASVYDESSLSQSISLTIRAFTRERIGNGGCEHETGRYPWRAFDLLRPKMKTVFPLDR